MQAQRTLPAGAQRTTLVSIAAAALLVALKLGVGLATHSLGLISAGIESSGDVVAAVLTFFAVRLAGRPADRGHPYGHRRAENLGALGEAAILIGGALLVAVEAITRLINGGHAPEIRWYQFAVIGLALVVDLSRTSVSLIASRRYDSPALRSNALHFAATPTEARVAAERAIADLGEEIELRRLRLRESAGRYFADVVVSVPAGQAVVEGHRAADHVEQALEATLPGSDVVVHVEPRRRGLDLRDRVLAIALSEPLVKEAHDIAVFEDGERASVSLHLKFPADLDLRSAHEIAERVERAILEQPGVDDVQTHLEPLERPLRARPAGGAGEQQAEREARELLRRRTGREPERVRLLATDAGPVLFLTLAGRDGESLTDAHLLASRLEDELRGQIEGLADVVIHTEP